MSRIIIKTDEQIEGIRKSCKLAAKTLEYAASFITPGISTLKLNDLAHEFIVKNKAVPAPLGYNGFPKSICTSINSVVCHGIPSSKDMLHVGDIINIDITTILDGYFGDISATYPVGKISEKNSKLIARTKQALTLAIGELAPNKYLNNCVGATIQNYLHPFGYGIVRLLGGHGVGLKFHEEPFIYHYNTHQNDVLLQPGMIFTIEPMVNASPSSEITIDKHDGWTVRTTDGANSCQFEHTVLITSSGHEVLTEL